MRALNLVPTVLFQSLRALGRSRSDVLLENVALRQQINALIKTKPLPRLQPEERMLWVAQARVERCARRPSRAAPWRRFGRGCDVAARSLGRLSVLFARGAEASGIVGTRVRVSASERSQSGRGFGDRDPCRGHEESRISTRAGAASCSSSSATTLVDGEREDLGPGAVGVVAVAEWRRNHRRMDAATGAFRSWSATQR
jgi:hypothetical protein